MTTVALIAFTGAQSLDIAGPMDVFSEANRFLLPEAHYKLEVIGVEQGPLRCSNGIVVSPDRHYSGVDDAYDLLLVAGGPELVRQEFSEDFNTWLRRSTSRARKYGSICSGAFVLARAGLLDGKTATTHWNYADSLKRLCPSTRIEADRLYVQDGLLYTSAGVTAGIDLSLYLLTQEKGSEVALNVAKRLVVFMQRAGGQSQFSPYLTPYVEESSPVAQVQQYVLANLTGDLSVSVLAQVANMSARNFARTFTRDTKIPPAEFVESARVDAARVLLENTTTPLKTIAYECGFNDAHRMRSVFQRRLGVSPRQYRLNFAAPRFDQQSVHFDVETSDEIG
ncbi:GlxA family transcriptional regulator [Paraburkholderia sp. RL18-103-BIB-C]|uniref:GlxA family transcriptional regulator n=1 Tax=unclassified Paraburkholderia TaxID=2615204 RepID=UPI0038B8C2DB